MKLNELFNPDNPFFTGMEKLMYTMYLSLLWCLVSIPVITIGPATAALYHTVVKVIRKETGRATNEFFSSFRVNFIKGIVITAVLILYMVLTLLIIGASGKMKTGTWLDGYYPYIARAFLIPGLMIGVYIFPLLSRFTCSIKEYIRSSMMMSIRHFLSTVLFIGLFIGSSYLIFLVPICIIIIPALLAFVYSLSMEAIFRKYMIKPQCEEDMLPWYWR